MRTIVVSLALALASSPGPAPLLAQPFPIPVAPSREQPPPILEALAIPVAPALSAPALHILPGIVGPLVTPSQAEFAAISAVPCPRPSPDALPDAPGARPPGPCLRVPNPYTRFVDTSSPIPLSVGEKALLALHNIKDPGNLTTIVYTAAFTVGNNSHTAYGPGWTGFGRNAGYSLLQDATLETFATFAIPSLVHEDPRYHRMPRASVPRRFVQALSHTVIARADHGAPMPNFAALLAYPISCEISNLYVPGINDNGPSTVRRILTGYATDPIENVVTEFLPDVARHIHVRVIFVQRVLNRVSSDQ